MSKKLSDTQCRENYNKLRELFDSVIKDHARFEMVYACGVDAGIALTVIVRVYTYTYASYAVGFDDAANEIVILPIVKDLSGYGEPIYLKNSEIKKAKQSLFSKEITIWHSSLPQTYIQLNVSDFINEDPDDVVLLVKQDEEAKRFAAFFKNRYKK